MKMSLFILLLSVSSFLAKDTKIISLLYEEDTGFYIIPISFGSNEEEFQIQVDTTTSETWIPSYKTTLKVKKNITYQKVLTDKEQIKPSKLRMRMEMSEAKLVMIQ